MESKKKENKFDLYKQIKHNIKNINISCKDPITEQSFYCFDCHVSTCPQCSLDLHKKHNILCRYPYYQFDNKIIDEQFKDIDDIVKEAPTYLNVKALKEEMKKKLETDIKGIIANLNKIKEDKSKEIDKIFNGSEGSISKLYEKEEEAKKQIKDFFEKEKEFFKIDNNNTPGTSDFNVDTNSIKKGLEASSNDAINYDYGNMAFLINYDLLSSTNKRNKDIKSTLLSIKSACDKYNTSLNNQIAEVKKQIEILQSPTKEQFDYHKLNDDHYKEIYEKILKYIDEIKSTQQTVYDSISKTGQYEEIEKKNYMFELKQKKNIDTILNSSNEIKEPTNASTNNDTGKLHSSTKIRHFDTARRSYLSNFSETKSLEPFQEPKVKLNSPKEVNLGSSAVQKYFAYLTMDLVNKYFRPDKKKNDMYTIPDDLDEEIEIAKPIPNTNEIQIYDRKTRVITKQKVPMEKAKLKYNYFLNGCRSVVIKDKVYITGGVDKEKKQSKCSFVYYLKTNEIKAMPDMIKTHAYHSIEYLEYYKAILVIGGENNGACEIFDMFSGKWKPLPELNYPRANTCVYLDKMTHMLYCFFGILGNMSTASTFSDVIECIELKKACLGWGKVEYKNKADMDFRFGLCRIFPLDMDRVIIYGASGVRESAKKAAVYLLNKNEIVKINSQMINEMRLKAKTSKKLTRIISSYIKK